MIPCPLIAYDAAGNVVGTLDALVHHDADGKLVGIVDFAAHEEAGGEHTDIWRHSKAAGSKVWPEWIGARAHEFRVELDGPPGQKRIAALVHKVSGHRRKRADLEAAIGERIAEKRARAIAEGRETPEPADIRDLVGGPDAPLALDDKGRTRKRVKSERPTLPLIASASGNRPDTGSTGPASPRR